MSMNKCLYCDEVYDEDFNVEHPEECESNPDNSESIKTLEERLEDAMKRSK